MKKSLAIYIALIFIFACRNSSQSPNQMTQQELNGHLENANKIRVQNESKQIDEYASAHHYQMERTGTGLRLERYVKKNSSDFPIAHNELSIVYKVFLLDGTMCYETDSTAPLSFRLSEGQEPRGLEEGLMMMTVGEKARMVLPMHLAYGLSGDGDKIPPGAALFIDVELLKVTK